MLSYVLFPYRSPMPFFSGPTPLIYQTKWRSRETTEVGTRRDRIRHQRSEWVVAVEQSRFVVAATVCCLLEPWGMAI
jgi:hypothetical protein